MKKSHFSPTFLSNRLLLLSGRANKLVCHYQEFRAEDFQTKGSLTGRP
jgi:hypothetical protein